MAGFALGVWKYVSRPYTLITGDAHSSIIGAILHDVPISVSREDVAIEDKGADCFGD